MSKVTLTRPGWEGHGWSLHGVFFNINFDEKGVAVLDDDDQFRKWIEPNCNQNGVTVTRQAAPKAKATKAKGKK